jgi:hypothetical protein
MNYTARGATNFEYTERQRYPRIGRLVFAGCWLLVIGLLDLFYAISVIAGSEIFITTASWLVGDTHPPGWLMLVVAMVQLAAAPAVWLGRRWAFWVAIASICAHAVAAIMFMSEALVLGIALFALDVTVLFSLVTTVGERRPRF